MKVICSEGGPLIGISRDYMCQWSGAFGKRFIGHASPSSTDYDALGEFTDGRVRPILNVTKFPNSITTALLFAIPVETAIIAASTDLVLIAQVEAADEGWLLSDVRSRDLDSANFDATQAFRIELETCTFVIFDSAHKAEDVGDDCLTFQVEPGHYRIMSAIDSHNELAELNILKIKRINQL